VGKKIILLESMAVKQKDYRRGSLQHAVNKKVRIKGKMSVEARGANKFYQGRKEKETQELPGTTNEGRQRNVTGRKGFHRRGKKRRRKKGHP